MARTWNGIEDFINNAARICKSAEKKRIRQEARITVILGNDHAVKRFRCVAADNFNFAHDFVSFYNRTDRVRLHAIYAEVSK